MQIPPQNELYYGIGEKSELVIFQIRIERQVKICSPEESGRTVAHVLFQWENYETMSSKLADENAKC